MHIWVGLYMWENRYRQFKDKRWDRTCGKRGMNQKVGPYMWENVPPFTQRHLKKWTEHSLNLHSREGGGVQLQPGDGWGWIFWTINFSKSQKSHYARTWCI
jgi:hypothetical protein